MKLLFKVGDDVFARIKGFEPFPATVESVLLNESDCSVFYYVRFHGASEIVPLDASSLQSIQKNKPKFLHKYSKTELKKESKLRVDAVLGADDDIPEVLMNFVTVDSDFEEVSDDTVKKLGLYSITLTPKMVESLDEKMSPTTDEDVPESELDDEYIDIEDLPDEDIPSKLKIKPKAKRGYGCSRCHSRFRSRRSLGEHQNQGLCSLIRPVFKFVPKKQPNQVIVLEETSQAVDHDYPVKDLIMIDKSKWASRSASGYYPCKLCFRKFRSIGEAQLHMSLHKPQQRRDFAKYQKAQINSYESDSTDYEENTTGLQKHSSMERIRRAELAAKFAELAQVAGVEERASKIKILEEAKSSIARLEKESEDQDGQLAHLQDTNVRLRARYLELDPDGSSLSCL